MRHLDRPEGPGAPAWAVVAAALCLALLLAAWPGAFARARGGGDEGADRVAFKAMCSQCHAEDAQGDGPRHSEFLPPPANLTLTRNTRKMYESIVEHGIPGTAMPGFGPAATSPVAYFEGQPAVTEREWRYPWRMTDPGLATLSAGRDMYVTACRGCHGEQGAGDGPWAEGDDHIWPKPVDFHARNSEPERLYYIIKSGRPGTMMPPQPYPERSLWALALYAGSLYDPNSGATMRRPSGEPPRYHNPHGVTDMKAVHQGETKFTLYCSGCHGGKGRGSHTAPRLVDRYWLYGAGSDNAFFSVISKGIPGKQMISFAALPEEWRWSIITFLRHRGGLPEALYQLEHEQVQAGGGK